MAGFLDQKERVMDTIITQEGRSQLARFGKLNPAYYSFSDGNVVYETDTIVSSSTISGLEKDETYRPMLESMSNVYDTIAFEKNDAGFVNRTISQTLDAYFLRWQISLKNGEFFVKTSAFDQTFPLKTILGIMNGGTSADMMLEQYANTALTSSYNAFKNQHILQSPEQSGTGRVDFDVSPKTVDFIFSDTAPIKNKNNQEADINHIESLFWDKKLSHLPNFMFLPPVQKSEIGAAGLVSEQSFSDLSQNPVLTFDDLKTELSELDRLGAKSEIIFSSTSDENNLFSQMFEYNNGIVSKLDIIDFGLFKDGGVTKHVYFVGKLYQDSNAQSTFVNIFTLVFELSEV